jgi:N-acetylmuramoyl-L-alanine amidase
VALLDFNGSPHGGSQRHLPEWQSQPKITPTTIIDHSIVGSGESAWQMFATRSGLESHFIVLGRRSGLQDGHIWQLMTTDRQADANLNGNGYALSIETEDDGDPDTQPWTGAQLRSLIWLHAELRRVHPTIPQRESRSCADPGGHGFHTMHGAPSCWTPVAKTCPGVVRRRQWEDVLLPAYLGGTPTLEDDMTPEESRQLRAVYDGLIVPGTQTPDETVNLLFARVRTIEAAVQPQVNAVAQLQAQVAELTQLVKGLALGDLGTVELVGEFTGTANAQTSVPPPP